MLSTSTPETNNPIADACEAAGIPQVSTVQPWEAFYFGRGAKPGGKNPFRWTHHFSFGTADFAGAYISQWNGPVKTNKKVGVMWPNDADGNAIRASLGPILQKAGYTIVDPGAVPGRHDRLHGADHEVQGGELPDLQHLPAPARLRDLLAPGRAAGVCEPGEDRPDREGGALRVGDRRPRLASATTSRPRSTGARPGPTARSRSA